VGLCKGTSVCATSALDNDELKLRITAAIETFGRNMLERVWAELDYRPQLELALSVFRARKASEFSIQLARVITP
jgi:hypothetical protein